MNSINPSQTNNQSNKYNLIQNFYLIGYSPEDFFKVNPQEKTGEFSDIFNENLEDMPQLTPKIITKYPNIKNSINTIPDEIVLEHCFPNKIFNIIKKSKDDDNTSHFFYFELDNIPQNYENEEKSIYSKIYFTCLEINESLSNYFQYKKEIINLIFRNNSIKIINFNKNEPQGIDLEKKYSIFQIPKILCFASLLPFNNELSLLLKNIYDYSITRKDFSSLPLEKVIEKIIFSTSIPLDEELIINFQTLSFKSKIQFPLCDINQININYSSDMSLAEIVRYLSIDDIIKIFKYFLYEIPILFFSENKLYLSLFIDTFLTVLSPFKYAFPHISLLPKDLYGLISSEQKYIFGINENYNENFFYNNNIELDKTIVVVSINIDENKKNPNIKIEEKVFDNKNMEKLIIERKGLFIRYEDFIIWNDNKIPILSVDIPSTFKKILFEGISKYLSFTKRKNFFSKKEDAPKDLTFKIQTAFYKFFVYILSGYTEYFIKTPFFNDPQNIGDKMLFKKSKNLLKEVFNYEDFILRAPKDYQIFYKILTKTILFYKFFYDRVYSNNIIEQFALRQFDQLTYLKKHNEMRKKKENKNIFENFKKDVFEKVKIDKKEEIIINDNNSFSNKEIMSFISDEEKNTDILLKYGQLIKEKEPGKNKSNEKNQKDYSKLIEINYCLFPKLLFEYLESNNKLLNLNNIHINNFALTCKKKKEEYEKDRPYIYTVYEKLLDKIVSATIVPITTNEFEVTHNNYINFIWLILLSCSLWYCEPEEKIYRLDKLFEVLNKIENIEEYVLKILYINLYKTSDTLHFIKIYLIYLKYMGYMNYYYLNLLCNKIKEKENYLLENENIRNKENDLILSKRYLIKLSSEFSKKRKKVLTRSSVMSEDTEEILFSSEQLCIKCNEVGDINPSEVLKTKINLNEENYKYKCPKCNNEQDIIINYQLLLFNYLKKEAFITETGHFKLLTPYKLYKYLKQYLVDENITELGINNIFDIKEKINLINILFYFSSLNISYDFLLPYVLKVSSSMKLFFENSDNKENIKIKNKNVKEPIRITYQDEVSFIFRKFNNIAPKLNLKKKNSILGFEYGNERAVETDLSFTIKNSKPKSKK